MIVDLPHPEDPIIAVESPYFIEKLILFKTLLSRF